MNAGERLMKVREFAERIGVSASTAKRKVAAGEVTVVNVGSQLRPRLRITERALTAYVQAHEIEGAA